jgi:hypothetical protein
MQIHSCGCCSTGMYDRFHDLSWCSVTSVLCRATAGVNGHSLATAALWLRSYLIAHARVDLI